MSGVYQIRVKSDAGDLLAILDDYRTFSFSKIVNEGGSCTIEMHGKGAKVSLFTLDGQIEIWRRDIAYNIDWYLEWEGFIRKFLYEFDDSGDLKFTVNAFTYNSLLKRRIIAYTAGSAQTVKSAPADDVMKSIVRENLGADALVLNGRILDGVMVGLSVAADTGEATVFAGQNSYKEVFEIISQIAKSNLVDFDIVGVGDGLFQFRTFFPTRGINLTTDGLSVTTGLNSSGNAPVIFNPLLGNMDEPSYDEDRSEEKTVSIVAGQGTEEDRNVLVAYSAAYTDSPFNQIEMMSDSRNSEGNDDLASDAALALSETQQKQTFEFKPIQTPTSAYGNQYNWGDYVTAQFGNLSGINKRIMKVSIGVDGSGQESIDLELATFI
jgi:hypothetical protein